MSTLNGIGTNFYGWRHNADQPSTATKWLVFLYLPILPLSRWKLIQHTDLDNLPVLSRVSEKAFGMTVETYGHVEYIDMIEKTPLVWSEVFSTYTKAYLLMPLLLVWPILIFALCLWIDAISSTAYRASSLRLVVLSAAVMLFLGNFILVITTFVRRAKGSRSPIFRIK